MAVHDPLMLGFVFLTDLHCPCFSVLTAFTFITFWVDCWGRGLILQVYSNWENPSPLQYTHKPVPLRIFYTILLFNLSVLKKNKDFFQQPPTCSCHSHLLSKGNRLSINKCLTALLCEIFSYESYSLLCHSLKSLV